MKLSSLTKLIYFAAIAAPLSLGAIPARRTPIVRLQPDGTQITVRLIGDERGHALLSEDGHMLIADNNGFYCYAVKSASGEITSSGVIANSPERRSAAERSFVASLNAADTEEMVMSRLNAPQQRVNATPGRNTSTFPTQGEVRSLVILVNYTDVKIKTPDVVDYTSRQWNEQGFSDDGATGSVRDYFIDQSRGAFKPTFDIYGPVDLPNNMAYYGKNLNDNDIRPHEMALHACQILDDEIDFSVYDSDSDGYIDNVYIIYAGYPESNGAGDDCVWPHSFEISSAGGKYDVEFDGVILDHYACSSELMEGLTPSGIGTPCHEFSHVLGLPDLYDTAGAMNAQTPYTWSVLDQGCYNNNARTPLGYSIFERFALGWMEPIELNAPQNVTLDNIATGQGAIVLTEDPDEYFLFENRQQVGWDLYAPAHGMLIWHIDYDKRYWDRNIVNNDQRHQRVDIEEADNSVGTFYNPNPEGDTFPGTSGNTSFTSSSKPAMLPWDKIDLDTPITDITEHNGLISFKVKGGTPDSGIDINGVADQPVATCQGNTLTITCPQAATADVYDTTGRLVASLRCDPAASTRLPQPGIYIVKAGGRTLKIACTGF